MTHNVAFQGEHGAYSQQAAKKFFGNRLQTIPCKEFETVFNKVKNGSADFGVLPVENSLTGSIHKNYDLIIQHKIWITGEIKLRISHQLLGSVYKLRTLASSIENNPNNFTRFIVIRKRSKSDKAVRNANKTSIVFTLKNIPGALYKSLSVFAIRDIDLLKIESRPIHGSPWQYMFYLDISGSCNDEKVAKAIEHLKEVTDFLQLLGSYPRG
jgi:prephenate dehydratase